VKRGPGPVHLLLAALLAAALAAVWREGGRSREDPGAVLAALRAAQGPALPPAAKAGALSASEPARYGPERLHELVNGAAEGYLARGFAAGVTRIYSFSGSAGPFEVAAEAHRFATEGGALGQLAVETPRAALPVAGLPGAVSDGSVLLAASRRDLLKLTSLAADPRGPQALLDLARAWEAP
jgi:hypothetical protein